jgi:uncharacterized protein (DUF58 family)
MARLGGLGLLGTALMLAAGLFDAELLWVPGVALLVLAATLALALASAARGARVERRLPRTRVEEGETLAVELRARTGPPGLVGGEARTADGGAASLTVRPGRRTAAGVEEMTWERRGRHELPPATLELRDPLGFGRRTVRGPAGDAVLVLPRIEPVRSLDGGLGLVFGTEASGPVAGAEADQDGLRPYRPGAPANRIHWPALARGAGLVERRLLPDADRLPLVVLDPSGGAGEADLDAAVRAAASIAWSLARRGGCALLLPGEQRATTLDGALAAWPAAHARLALVAPGPPLALGARLARHRTLVWVAAGPHRLPPPAPGAARYLVVPGAPGGGVPVLEVAGCTGYRAGARAEPRAA